MSKKIKMFLSFLIISFFSINFASAQTVITFLHGETDTECVVAYEKIARDYEKLNPNVKIEISTVGSKGRLKKVITSAMAKKLPSIYKVNPEDRDMMVDKGWLIPLDSIATGELSKESLGQWYQTTKGKIYDLPYTVSHFSVMWYNKGILDAAGLKPPKDWNEWEKQAKLLTKGEGADKQYGTMIPAGKNRYTSMFLTMMMWNAGGTFFDKDYNVTFNNPGTIKALEFMKRMSAYTPPGQGSASYSYGDKAFMSGKTALVYGRGRVPQKTVAKTPDLMPVLYGATIPMGPAGGTVKYANSNGYGVSSSKFGNSSEEESLKFLKYLLTGERMIEFSLSAHPHTIPPQSVLQSDDRLLNSKIHPLGSRPDLVAINYDMENSSDFISDAGMYIKNGKTMRPNNGYNPYMGGVIGKHIPAQVVQRVLLANESIPSAVAWGHKEIEKIVAEAQ
jgi:ABC-type glycerol-3-phosphate transport system substrate-binding protein